MIIKYKHRANNPLDPYKYRALEIDAKSDGNKVVLGHNHNELTCSLIEYLDNCNPNTELAINIKQSGICDKLFDTLKSYTLKSYFVFDMAFSDYLEYEGKYPEHTASRLSEFENNNLYKNFRSKWVWVDIFTNYKFFDQSLIIPNKNIVVVSPELHNSNYKYEQLINNAYGICTDEI